MSRNRLVQVGLLLVLALVVIGVAYAAAPKSYQVTGPVLSLSDTQIVVQKGNDKWEIGRDAATKVTGDLKVGSKVTIVYKMTAVTVEVKPEKGK